MAEARADGFQCDVLAITAFSFLLGQKRTITIRIQGFIRAFTVVGIVPEIMGSRDRGSRLVAYMRSVQEVQPDEEVEWYVMRFLPNEEKLEGSVHKQLSGLDTLISEYDRTCGAVSDRGPFKVSVPVSHPILSFLSWEQGDSDFIFLLNGHQHVCARTCGFFIREERRALHWFGNVQMDGILFFAIAELLYPHLRLFAERKPPGSNLASGTISLYR